MPLIVAGADVRHCIPWESTLTDKSDDDFRNRKNYGAQASCRTPQDDLWNEVDLSFNDTYLGVSSLIRPFVFGVTGAKRPRFQFGRQLFSGESN